MRDVDIFTTLTLRDVLFTFLLDLGFVVRLCSDETP